MTRSFSLALALFVGSLIIPAAAAATIRCDLDGYHGTDPDRMAPGAERALLLDALRDTEPRLPADLKAIAPRVTFVIDHRHTALTKALPGGWSAEDDDEYRYPDRAFYPQGTIKVNLTERFLQLALLLRELGGNPSASPDLRAGSKTWVRMVVAHELMHALQYHRAPVRDLEHTHAITEGLPDPVILEETGKKVAYEHAAFEFGRTFVTRSQLLAIAGAMESYMSTHPEEFREGARFGLCGKDGTRGFRSEAEMIGRGGEFSARQKVLVAAQYELPKAALELKRLNDQLRMLKPEAAQARLPGLQTERSRIEARWNEYRVVPGAPPGGKDLLVELMPPMRPVLERYEAEHRESERLLQSLKTGH